MQVLEVVGENQFRLGISDYSVLSKKRIKPKYFSVNTCQLINESKYKSGKMKKMQAFLPRTSNPILG